MVKSLFIARIDSNDGKEDCTRSSSTHSPTRGVNTLSKKRGNSGKYPRIIRSPLQTRTHLSRLDHQKIWSMLMLQIGTENFPVSSRQYDRKINNVLIVICSFMLGKVWGGDGASGEAKGHTSFKINEGIQNYDISIETTRQSLWWVKWTC